MADQEVTHTLVRLDGVTARQVNQNFRDVTEFVNGQTVHTDGTGLTAALSANLLWAAWTPAVVAVSTNPTLGTGSTAAGRWLRVGSLVVGHGRIKFGTSGVAAGTGLYRVELPVATATADAIVGSGYIWDSSTGNARTCALRRASVATRASLWVTDAEVGHNVPWTWAANDEILFQFAYEAA